MLLLITETSKITLQYSIFPYSTSLHRERIPSLRSLHIALCIMYAVIRAVGFLQLNYCISQFFRARYKTELTSSIEFGVAVGIREQRSVLTLPQPTDLLPLPFLHGNTIIHLYNYCLDTSQYYTPINHNINCKHFILIFKGKSEKVHVCSDFRGC